jgi:chemotaxis protein methyltransferase CheR
MLRQRVLQLFHDSLSLFGMLGLDREIGVGDPLAANYQAVFPHQSWYKRIA